MIEYSFLATNLLTGDIIDEVELQSFNWKELYNRPGSASATVRIDDPTATRANFDSWRNALWLRQGDQIIWGGIMGHVTPVSGTRVLNVPVHGFFEYYRTRLLRGSQGMSNAVQIGSTIRWINKDVFQIAEDLINHARYFPTGDIGVEVVYDALSGVITSQTHYAYEYKPVGAAFEQLSDNIKGFDWRYSYAWNGNQPKAFLRLSKVPQGRRTDYVFEYDHTPGNKNIVSFDSEAGEMPANGIAAIGAGEGDAMKRTYVADLNTGYPLYEGLVSYKDVSLINTLANHANKHLARNKVPVQSVVVKLDPNKEPTHTEFICGDEVRLAVDDGWQKFTGYWRVVSKEMLLSKEHDLDLKIGLELVGA